MEGKKAKKKVTVGKPPINDPDDARAVQAKIDLYFDSLPVIDEETGKQERPTYCGLARALGYSCLQTMRDNAKSGKPISLPIKKGLLRVDETYERALHGNNPTGSIFALKNRGWKDKPEADDDAPDNVLTIDFKE